MKKKKVLIVTYYWPPAGGPGVQRWLKFAKYLRENDWEPVVLTTRKGWYPLTDITLENDVPKDLTVIKTNSFEPLKYYSVLSKEGKDATNFGMVGYRESQGLFKKVSRFIRANLFVPDARRGWNYFAVRAASGLIRRDKIDIIITTGPPHSSHLIGLELKELFDIPWMADFRDPWVKMLYNDFLPRLNLVKSYDVGLEKKVIEAADCIITISERLKHELTGIPQKTVVLPNGYDDDDFKDLTSRDSTHFTLVHTGSLGVYQNSEGLWRALQELTSEDKSFKNDLKIELVGKTDDFLIKRAWHHQLADNIKTHPYVNHDEVVKRMVDSSMLLFIIANVSNNEMIIGGKLLEYLAAQRPLLALGPVDGEAANLLKDYTSFAMYDYDDSLRIKNEVRKIYQLWKVQNNGGLSQHNQRINDFSRKNLTRKLSSILNTLVSAK